MEEITKISNREKLLKSLIIPKKIQEEYTYEEQCCYIYEEIEFLLKKSIISDNKNINNSNYELNKIQNEIFEKIKLYLKDEDIINIYYKVIEFIENSEDKNNIYQIELEKIKEIIEKLKEIIKKKVNIEMAFENIIDKMNLDSKIIFLLQEGNMLLKGHSGYNEVILTENILILNIGDILIQCFASINDIDRQIINNMKSILIKYKKEIFKYSKIQKEKNIVEETEKVLSRIEMMEYVYPPIREKSLSNYKFDFNGTIDNINFQIYDRYPIIDIEADFFFKRFRKEIWKLIDDIIKLKIAK